MYALGIPCVLHPVYCSTTPANVFNDKPRHHARRARIKRMIPTQEDRYSSDLKAAREHVEQRCHWFEPTKFSETDK